MILKPMLNRHYPERSSDCELALEVQLQELIDRALAAGWERKEAIAAIANIAIRFMVTDAENKGTDFCIAAALGKVEH
jgi:hypothetical protein